MSKKKDIINIIDIEATCWEDKVAPKDQFSEIIEIGICEVNLSDFSQISKESILIKPIHSEISEFCTHLTTITSDMIEKDGITFPEACSILYKKYDSHNRIWASWGDYDRLMFEEECKYYNIRYPFRSHINLKPVFSIFFNTKEMGMQKALDYLKLPLIGTHHRGLDDASNIASILEVMMRSRI